MSIVKIVVGLGNPGREYAGTRHNLGFMVVDELARRFHGDRWRNRFRAEITQITDGPDQLILAKPQTFMNLSGTAVREVLRWYKTAPEDTIVVVDDIDLPFQTIRMRPGGGSGGHNGMKSIIAELGTDAIPRLRLGIGRGSGDASRQVLTRFSSAELAEVPAIVTAAADCVTAWHRDGIIAAMNRCNRRLDDEQELSESQAREAADPSDDRSERTTLPRGR
jgi:peptidyl-tRNA hydrolase, PTH1 family